jgi:hypothetical protein
MKTFKQFSVFLIFYFLLIRSIPLFSQENSDPICGTITTNKDLESFKNLTPVIKKYESIFLNSKSSQTKSNSITKNYVPIKAHVIRTSNGNGGISEQEINEAIKNINITFSEAYLEFFLCNDIDYIDNDDYYHFKTSQEKSLVEENNVSNVINIYFADEIENSSDENICGYTYNKQNYDIIIIQNGCATNDSSLAHEIGHFFSLIHTHGIDNSCLTKELVNGNNCSSSGDQICDTPADPKLTYKNLNNFCRYIGTEKDANGDSFTPDTSNIMSYSMKGCRSHFSNQQLARIYAYYISNKSYLTCVDSSDVADSYETDDSKLLDFKIYPNPISGNIIYVKPINTTESYTFEISNLMGQVFSIGTLTSEAINVEYLASGTYLMTIKNNDSKIIKRIIK